MPVNCCRAVAECSAPYSEGKADSSRNTVLDKVWNIASRIFQAIASILSIPFRYLGSKSWSLPGILIRLPIVTIRHLFSANVHKTFKEDLFGSGYHRFDKRVLNSEEIKPYIQYAAAAAAIHGKHFDSWTDPLGFKVVSPKDLIKDIQGGIPQGLLVKDDCFFDQETGLKAALLVKGNRYMLVFGALRSSSTELDKVASKLLDDKVWNNCGASIAGFVPTIYLKANRLVEMVKEIPAIKSGSFELCGQCLGGSLASFAGIKNQIKATCLNTFPLGAGLQYELGNERLNEADKYITHISCKTDFMSDLPKVLGVLDSLVNFIGIRTCGNFGKKFLIPNPFPNYSGKTHNNIAAAMFLHAGFKEKDRPGDILPDPRARALV